MPHSGVALSELPHFVVSKVHKNYGTDRCLTLDGHFTGPVWTYKESWFGLIYKDHQVLHGKLAGASGSRSLISVRDENLPYLAGELLACLPPSFPQQKALMIVDPRSVWENISFVAAEGRYLKRKQLPREIPLDWDHDHCPICGSRISHGQQAWYSEKYTYYVCTDCFIRYVEPKRLPIDLPK